jgi:putative transport protein
MLDLARDIIGSQPILTAFLAIGLGYLVGQINLGGFSLGVGAVLFVGLAIGAFAPKAQITGPIGLTGLIMFLYGIGILYGRQFFEGMVGAGRSTICWRSSPACRLVVALGLGHIFGIKIGHTLGIYAGSMTSTATLQAALDVMKNKDPSIGYSIAYPFGVIGPILCIYFMTRIVKPKFPAKAQRFHMGEISIGESLPATLDELTQGAPLRRAGHDGPQGRANFVPAGRYDSVRRRRRSGRRRAAKRRSPGGRQAWETGAGPPGQRPRRSRLHPGLRRQGQYGRHSARAASDAGRLSDPSAACPPL